MDNFDYVINSVFQREGGFQNYATDIGNYFPQSLSGQLIGTNFGITPTTYKNWFGYVPTVEDMQSLSKEEAKQLYYNSLWLPYGFNNIENKYVANIVFDTFVLFNYFSFSQIVPFVNNKMDFAKMNNANPTVLVNDIVQRRIDMHKYNIEQNYVSGEFLDGWINRANSFKIINQSITSYMPYALVGIGAIFMFWYYNKDNKK